MRGLLVPLLAGGLIAAGVAILVYWLRRRAGAAQAAARTGVAEVLATHGAGRCLAGARLLRRLAALGDSAAIVSAWQTVEMPLVEAAPDCPPDQKVELIDACTACANACTNRETARGIMAVRNSLLR